MVAVGLQEVEMSAGGMLMKETEKGTVWRQTLKEIVEPIG